MEEVEPKRQRKAPVFSAHTRKKREFQRVQHTLSANDPSKVLKAVVQSVNRSEVTRIVRNALNGLRLQDKALLELVVAASRVTTDAVQTAITATHLRTSKAKTPANAVKVHGLLQATDLALVARIQRRCPAGSLLARAIGELALAKNIRYRGRRRPAYWPQTEAGVIVFDEVDRGEVAGNAEPMDIEEEDDDDEEYREEDDEAPEAAEEEGEEEGGETEPEQVE